MAKRKRAKAKTPRRKLRKGSEDTRVRRKYRKGGRVEAYTFGEALGSKDWP